jgi:hypothetical protein
LNHLFFQLEYHQGSALFLQYNFDTILSFYFSLRQSVHLGQRAH